MDEAWLKREERKLDHIKFSLSSADGPSPSGFGDVQIVHQALPELNIDEVSTEARFLGKGLRLPLIINAITGGTAQVTEINRSLARVARKTGVAMAIGSQAAALDNEAVVGTFQVVRQEYPGGPVLANVGAGTSPADALRAVEMVAADGLQVHLNVPQELTMGEGDRNFKGLLRNLARIRETVPVPVIAKEVGFGISRETAGSIYGAGIRYIDVGGQGGTNFVAIEQLRAQDSSGEVMDGWGIPTAVSLVETLSLGLPFSVIASGGIRSPLDMAKAITFGAQAVGVAGLFLRTLMTSSEQALVDQIQAWETGLRRIMLMVGARRLADLTLKPVVITGKTREWLDQRGVATVRYSRR